MRTSEFFDEHATAVPGRFNVIDALPDVIRHAREV